MRFFLLFVQCLWLAPLQAQKASTASCRDSVPFCVVGVEGMQRPKGLSLNYSRMVNAEMTAGENLSLPGQARVSASRSIDARIKAPLFNSPGFKAAIALKYKHEQFRYSDYGINANETFQALDDLSLQSRSAELYLIKPFRGKNYLVARPGIQLNGNYSREGVQKRDHFFASSVVALARQFSPKMAVGVGVYGSWRKQNGDTRLLPVVAYTHTLSKNWGIEALLPSNLKVRYSNDKQSLFAYASAAYQSSSFYIGLDQPVLYQDQNLDFRMNRVELSLRVEREIYDFLWIGADFGVQKGLGWRLDSNEGTLMEGNTGFAPYFSTGIFLVPPRKWMR